VRDLALDAAEDARAIVVFLERGVLLARHGRAERDPVEHGAIEPLLDVHRGALGAAPRERKIHDAARAEQPRFGRRQPRAVGQPELVVAAENRQDQ